jgi:hypothetical protein
MSDPIRWRASDGSAPAGARELLRHASPPTGLDAATRARHAAAIAKITAGAAPAAVAGSKLALGVKLLAGLGLAAAVAVSASGPMRAHLAPHRPAVVAPAQRAASAPVAPPEAAPLPVAVEEAPIAAAPPAVTPSPTPPTAVVVAPPHRPSSPPTLRVVTAAAPSAPIVAPSEPSVVTAPSGSLGVVGAPITAGASPVTPTEDPLQREGQLLQSAGAAVDADPQAALAGLDQHEREFPRGQLAAERELLAVQALRNLGRNDEARARGEALIARFPRTPYASRTRHLLDALP